MAELPFCCYIFRSIVLLQTWTAKFWLKSQIVLSKHWEKRFNVHLEPDLNIPSSWTNLTLLLVVANKDKSNTVQEALFQPLMKPMKGNCEVLSGETTFEQKYRGRTSRFHTNNWISATTRFTASRPSPSISAEVAEDNAEPAKARYPEGAAHEERRYSCNQAGANQVDSAALILIREESAKFPRSNDWRRTP